MKLRFFSLATLLFCLVACTPAKRFVPPDLTVDSHEKVECASVFPKGRWQFVHSIDFSLQDGSGTTVIGVTSLNGDYIDCALITVEGLSLFQAAYHGDKSFEVRRAVPPFDGPGFAKGLLMDIRTIFQIPQGRARLGSLEDGTAICRYAEQNGAVVDILPEVDDCWQIKRYTPQLILDRSIVGLDCKNKQSGHIPDVIELTGYGRTGYTLKMTLISADYFQ